MQQRGETQYKIALEPIVGLIRNGLLYDAQGVFVDILVVVVLVNLKLQGRQFGQYSLSQPTFNQSLKTETRMRAQHQLHKLGLHALGRNDLDALGHCGHGRKGCRFDFETELRGKARTTHHAQRVVAKRNLWRTRRANHSVDQIL